MNLLSVTGLVMNRIKGLSKAQKVEVLELAMKAVNYESDEHQPVTTTRQGASAAGTAKVAGKSAETSVAPSDEKEGPVATIQ